MEKTLRWLALAVVLALVGCAQPTEDKKAFTVSGTVSYPSGSPYGYTLEVFRAGALDSGGSRNEGSSAPLVTKVLTEGQVAKVSDSFDQVNFSVKDVAEGSYDLRVIIPSYSDYPVWFQRNLLVNQDKALGTLSLSNPIVE